MNNLDKHAFYEFIVTHLKENPDHLEMAIKATHAGLELALRDAQEIAASADSAFLAALGLLDTKRLTDDLKQQLSDVIVKRIKSTKNRCEIENKFLEAQG